MISIEMTQEMHDDASYFVKNVKPGRASKFGRDSQRFAEYTLILLEQLYSQKVLHYHKTQIGTIFWDEEGNSVSTVQQHLTPQEFSTIELLFDHFGIRIIESDSLPPDMTPFALAKLGM